MRTDAFPLTEVFDWHGAEVRWAKIGKGDPVVFCHGTAVVELCVEETLQKRHGTHRSVYLWDMVGYGTSTMDSRDVSLRAQGELLAALVAHWGLHDPDFVAHDYGGAVSLRAHLLHGMKIRSLALVDVVALRPWGSPFFRLVGEHAEVFSALPANLHEALVREYISGASGPGLADEVLDTLVEPWRGDGQESFYRQIAQADEAYTAEVEPLLSSIKVPTLVVWGTDDTWIPVDRADRLVGEIPGARRALIKGAGHLIQEDASGEFVELIEGWLREQVDRGSGGVR